MWDGIASGRNRFGKEQVWEGIGLGRNSSGRNRFVEGTGLWKARLSAVPLQFRNVRALETV